MPAAAPAESGPRSVPGCPSDDALLSFIPGLLNDDEASVVSAHVQGCSTCQSRVTTLRKRLSSAGGGPEAATLGDSGQPIRPQTERAQPANRSDPTAATTHYVPNRRQIPKQLGQYQVLEPIGRGGMGQVRKGYHPRLQRHVAIKLLLGLHLADNTAIVRLQREQAAAGRVQHENIVYAFDAGEQDGVDYLVMEYVEGIDLARLLAGHGPLPIAEACEIARQTALGLAHIESCGLVHRDIKPSNLMLSLQGVVKILDLGLARLREGPIDDEEATHSGFLLGTADYMSPEQIDTPREADVRSDLYSLGCTLFKLLAGRAPFSDEVHSSYSQKIDAHRRELPPRICTLRPDVPPALDELLQKMLAKDPAARPQHPAEVAEALAILTVGASLRSLAVRSVDQTAADTPPQAPAASSAPSVSISTHPRGRTPTPRELEVPARSSGKRWGPAAVVAAAASLLVLAIWWFWGPGYGSTPVPISGGADQAPALSQDFLATARTVPLVAREQSERLTYDPAARELSLSAGGKQLVALGEILPGSGKISFDLDFTDDLGDAGILLGRRSEVHDGERAVVGHLVYLSVLEPNIGPPQFRLWRMQALIRPNTSAPHSLVGRYEKLPPQGRARTFLFQLEYSREGLTSIKLNGKEYVENLVSQIPGQKFKAEDLWGEWGFYNDGATMRISNLRVSTMSH